MMLRHTLIVAVCTISSLMAGPAAHAQWVMVARAVSGRVQRMEQQKTATTGGYDVAIVILDAKADNVYATALNAIKSHGDKVQITSSSDTKRLIKFTDGIQNASLQANSLGPDVTQLVIASNGVEQGQTATSIVVRGVMKVCADMKVQCTLEQE